MTEPVDPKRDATARKHAAVAIMTLAGVAAIVALMFVFVGGNRGNTAAAPLTGPADITYRPPSSPVSSTSAPTNSATSSPSMRPSTPHVTRSCPTKQPCVLQGDAGAVLAALNSYRTQHQLTPLTGSVGADAQQCALQEGNAPPCPGGYFWEPVTAPSGAQVVAKISAQASGSQWLQSPATAHVTIGWSYSPTAGYFACALILPGS